MSYLIPAGQQSAMRRHASLRGLRGSLGGIATNASNAAKATGKPAGGSGTAGDPFGGMGGGWGTTSSGALAEAALGLLASAGLNFTNIEVQRGVFTATGEAYIFAKGSDGAFYKFRVNGSSFGHDTSDAVALDWFNKTVAAGRVGALPSGSALPSRIPPNPIPGLQQGGSGGAGGGGPPPADLSTGPSTVTIVVIGLGVLAAVGAVLFLPHKKPAALAA